jgi:two-component system sensor histidine kinase VicK
MAAGDLDQDIANAGGDETDDVVRALEAMAVRMQDLVQQQKDFIANASHQLRTPLTTIKLRVEALVGGARNDEAVASRFLTEIEGEVDRLSHLVDELLTLSRVEAGIETLKMERVNLGLVLGQTVVAFHPRAEAAGVTLTLDTAPGLPAARASASHVRQVMDNLLDNALKHTPAGGLVTVSCRLVNGLLAVLVTDTGQGIPAQDLPHVFDRFYRGRSTSRAAGSGLGLAIVRSIIEAHRGEVTLESQEGKGTSVRFTLPALEQQQST